MENKSRLEILEEKNKKEQELAERRQELKKVIFDEKEKKNKKVKKHKSTNLFLSLLTVIVFGFISFLLYLSQEKINQLYYIINAFLILIIYITFLIAFKRTLFYKKSKMIILTSFLTILMFAFNVLDFTGIINLPKQSYIPEFENINEAISWTEKNNIEYTQSSEYSDNIVKYGIISQNPKSGTLTKKIKKVNFEISNGPDYNKEVIIENMTDWSIDDAVNIIDENYLNNVTVNYTENEEVEKDIITEQNKYGTVKRNDEIILNVSLGKADELTDVKLNNLTNETLFKATLYLKRNAIDYELKYDFSDTIEKGKVINQSVKPNETVKPHDKITLTISKGKAIKVPKLKNMKMSKVIKWLTENNLKIKYNEKYDNKIKKGKVISANYKKGDIIEEETEVEITISKGKLKMPTFKTLDEFKTWANKYGVNYEIKEEFSDEKDLNNIIKFSVKTNKVLDLNEKIIVYVSKGKAITVPDFSNKTKSNANKLCSDSGLTCSFVTEYSTSVQEGNVISQSIKSGEKISASDTIVISIATTNKAKVTKSNSSTSNKNSNNNSSSSNSSSNKNNSSSSNKSNSSGGNTNNCSTIKLSITPDLISIGDAGKTCDNIKGKYGNYVTCNSDNEANGGYSGRVLNINEIQGITASSCNKVEVKVQK